MILEKKLCVYNLGGGGGGSPRKIEWGCAARFPKPLRPIYTLRFVVPICRPREIMKQIGACKWRPDARAISVRHVGRFGKNL